MSEALKYHIIKTIHLVSVFILLQSGRCTVYGFSGGNGQADSPYQIAVPEDLIAIGTDPNLQDKHFLLITEIDLQGLSWSTAVIPEFSGIFDGNDLIIHNLTISGDVNLGLFGTITQRAEIKNLGMENIDIAVNEEYSASHTQPGRVAGLAGTNQGHINHCFSTGRISGHNKVGGLVGENVLGYVSHCYSTCRVSGQKHVGGLVGVNQCFSVVNSCYSRGTIESNHTSAGLVGLNQGMVLNSYSSGNVNGDIYVGGLVGENNGSVAACYSTGRVSGTEDTGGLVGTGLGSVSHSFWNIQTSGQNTSMGGEGLNGTEMTDINTYLNAGWDFIDEISNGTSQIWHITESSAFPLLYAFDANEPNQPRGQGTPEDPYLITDTLELGTIYYRPGACYTMARPLDLSEIVWSTAVIPIFYGSFKGNSTPIRHLTIVGSGDLGLFGTLVHDAQVNHLSVADVNIVGTGDSIGGIAGSIHSGKVSGCYSAGIISGRDYIGGLAGYHQGIMSHSFSATDVTGRHRTGGLVGNNNNTISHCHSTGTVSGSKWTGGLMGSSSGYVEHSYSTGMVSGDDICGGLAGYVNGDINDCYSTSTVYGNMRTGGLVGHSAGCLLKSFSTGTVSGNIDIGGLAGNNSGTLNQCYSTSNTTGTYYIGGLVGINQTLNDVNNCYSSGAVSGQYWVGGLVGQNTGPISFCYSTGTVSGMVGVGGLVGRNESISNNITSCLWDTKTSEQTTSNGGEGHTTFQMKNINTFLYVGWDFVDETDNGTQDIWYMPANSYPLLWWQNL